MNIWMMDKIIQVEHRPTERLQVRLVPVAWRGSIWQCVHVHSVNHLGCERVYELLRRRFHWPGMAEDVRMMCRACLTCQHAKLEAGGGPTPRKHEYISYPQERVGTDLQGPRPETPAGNKYIGIIQDDFFKTTGVICHPAYDSGSGGRCTLSRVYRATRSYAGTAQRSGQRIR